MMDDGCKAMAAKAVNGIPQSLDDLAKATESLEMRIGDLIGRLDLILRPSLPENPNCGISEEQTSEISGRIVHSVRRVNVASEAIADLLNRIDL